MVIDGSSELGEPAVLQCSGSNCSFGMLCAGGLKKGVEICFLVSQNQDKMMLKTKYEI